MVPTITFQISTTFFRETRKPIEVRGT